MIIHAACSSLGIVSTHETKLAWLKVANTVSNQKLEGLRTRLISMVDLAAHFLQWIHVERKVGLVGSTGTCHFQP